MIRWQQALVTYSDDNCDGGSNGNGEPRINNGSNGIDDDGGGGDGDGCGGGGDCRNQASGGDNIELV